jgi:hypothetical protein
MGKIRPALDSVWPPDVPMQNFNLAFGTDAVVLDIQYQRRRDLDPVAVDVLRCSLQVSLQAPELGLKLQRTPPTVSQSVPAHR